MRSTARDPSNSLTAKVTERLRRAILDAEFELGEALSEEMLATALGVSRTPVREALTTLQTQGLIDIKPQRGSFVFSPSAEDVEALCEARRTLEGAALRLCFARTHAVTLERLREANEAMETARRAKNRLAVARADGAFHEAIAASSGNHYLEDAYKLVSGRIAALRAHNFGAGATNARNRWMTEHREIIAAFAEGNLAAADAILAGHIDRMPESYRAAQGRGALAKPNPGRRRAGADIALEGV